MTRPATPPHRRKPGPGKGSKDKITVRHKPPKTASGTQPKRSRKKPAKTTRARSRQNANRGDRMLKLSQSIRAPWQRMRKLRRRPWLLIVLSMLIAIAIGFGAPQLVLSVQSWRSDLPRTDEVQQLLEQPTLHLEVTADGSTPETCVCFLPVEASDVPNHLKDALLAAEDRRFKTHRGIDLIGIMRAVRANLADTGVVQGGSTITQQLAKSLVGNDRSGSRKLRELVLAKRIEAGIDKTEILRLYLDRAFFGRGATGIEAAARAFFAKPARDLTLFEAAALVGRLPAPSGPSTAESLEDDAREVLERMIAAEVITQAEADAALAEGPQPGQLKPLSIDIRHYEAWVGRVLHRNGIRGTVQVSLAVNPRHQMAAQDVIADAIAQDQLDSTQEVALGAIAPDGRVTALVGGRAYGVSQFDRASLARRQPGSTVKPFTFLGALEQGWTPEQMIDDAPVQIDAWQPRNHDLRYMGELTLTDALKHSRNAATIRLAQDVGADKVADLFERFGLPMDRERPAFLLGAETTRLLDLANAYASLAAGGRRVASTGILGVLDPTGNVLMRAAPSPQDRIADPDAVAALTTMLHDAARGDGLAGKSGTSQKNRDAWFAGFSDEATAAVWVGRDDASPMPGTFGGGVSAQIWRNFLKTIGPPAESRAEVSQIP